MNPRRWMAAKALLMAGLSLIGAVAFADGETVDVPARRVSTPITPTPMPTPMPTNTPFPTVRPEELKAAEAKLNAAIGDTLRKISDHSEMMSKELSAIKEKIQTLSSSQNEDRLQLDKQGKDARAFAVTLEESERKLDDGLKKVGEVKTQIESKGSRMEGLLDLVNTLKRDLNDNSHEIAELKRDFEAVKKVSQTPVEEQTWWDQLASWRYMPLTAAVLGGVALGVAASRK